jgi:hypothetical protein
MGYGGIYRSIPCQYGKRRLRRLRVGLMMDSV